jgi:Ni/Fe-hydrogenase subunit HybB-like protein
MGVAHVVEWIRRKPTVPHDILRTIARTSGLGLLLYAYIKFWDLAAVTYYGRTPGSDQAFNILRTGTPYGFGFWVGEIILGILVPVILFLAPRFNRQPRFLVLGAFLAMIGVIFNRWNVTVSGLVVPLDYAPGVDLGSLAARPYVPNLTEWAVALGVLGYALAMLTLGVRFLPLFRSPEEGKR